MIICLPGVSVAHPTPFGECLIACTQRGITGLQFCDARGKDVAWVDMQSRLPSARYSQDQAVTAKLVKQIFHSSAAKAQNQPLSLLVGGTPFQIKVWEALLTIPPGARASYTTIAESIDHPRAVRAVGTAIGRNPISWLIPCHRALRKSGGLGGYHWGLPIKRAMMAWEAAQDN